MDTIGERIATDFPDSNKGWGVGLDQYSNILINDDLKTVAKKKNIDLPTALDAKHQAVVDRLSKLSGAELL